MTSILILNIWKISPRSSQKDSYVPRYWFDQNQTEAERKAEKNYSYPVSDDHGKQGRYL